MENNISTTEQKVINFFNRRKIVINNSEARIPQVKSIDIPWFDNGDEIIIEFNGKAIDSLSINREDKKLEFIIDKSQTINYGNVSKHFLSIEICGLKIQDSKSTYDMEIIAQCNCKKNRTSNRDKIIFYFSESHGSCKHNHCLQAETDPANGAGGGWSSPPK